MEERRKSNASHVKRNGNKVLIIANSYIREKCFKVVFR